MTIWTVENKWSIIFRNAEERAIEAQEKDLVSGEANVAKFNVDREPIAVLATDRKLKVDMGPYSKIYGACVFHLVAVHGGPTVKAVGAGSGGIGVADGLNASFDIPVVRKATQSLRVFGCGVANAC